LFGVGKRGREGEGWWTRDKPPFKAKGDRDELQGPVYI